MNANGFAFLFGLLVSAFIVGVHLIEVWHRRPKQAPSDPVWKIKTPIHPAVAEAERILSGIYKKA